MSKTDGFLLMRRSLAEPAPPVVLPEGTELVPLVAADVGHIHSLLQFSYAPGYGSLRHDARDWWETLIADSEFDRNLAFVVKAGDRVVGFCLVWRSSFVRDIAVDGSFRRRGIGSALLSLAIEAMRKRGHEEIALKVDMYNANAQRLYAEFGFATD
jgi:ribosomal protein S18 acetylase RimI-like enzyme